MAPSIMPSPNRKIKNTFVIPASFKKFLVVTVNFKPLNSEQNKDSYTLAFGRGLCIVRSAYKSNGSDRTVTIRKSF
jgi:hypothetical protein